MLGDIYPRKQQTDQDNADNNNLTNSLDWDQSGIEAQEAIWQMPAPSSQDSVDRVSERVQPALPVDDDNTFPEYLAQNEQTEYSLVKAQELMPEKNEPEEQMHFGLETSRVTRVQILKKNIRRWEYIIQVLPFWKSGVITFNITFSILTVVGLALLVIFTFSQLPTQIPLIYQQVDGSWILINKSVLALLLVGLAFFEIVLLRLKRVIFNFDRRLSNVMATTQIFINLLAIIALVQIISLVLI